METLLTIENSIQVVRLTAPLEVEPLVQVFAAVAEEQGWQPGGALHAYPEASAYFALTAGEILVGGLQLVYTSASATLPIHGIWPEIDLSHRSDSAHVSILALKPEWRGTGELFWLLCTGVWRSCIQSGIEEVWLEATPKMLRWYRRIGWPLQAKGPLRPHWGEECYPCSLDLWEAARAVLGRAEHSPLFRRLVALGSRDLPEWVVQRVRGDASRLGPAPALTQAAK